MNKPFFTVIIPTLNEEKFLPRMLTSLSKQTDRDFEVIVVDGKSKDKTVKAAESYKSKLPDLKVLVSPKASLPFQRNYGAKSARADWYVFADADGAFLPYFIDRIKTHVAENKPKLFTTWFRPDTEVAGDALLTLIGNISIEMSIVIKRPHSPGPLTIVSRDVFESVGGYDEGAKYLEDFDFSWRLHKNKKTDLTILRESLCIWSLRRLREKGTLKFAQTYTMSMLSVLLNKPIRNLPGYVMGGHIYSEKKRRVSQSGLSIFNRRLKGLLKELFE